MKILQHQTEILLTGLFLLLCIVACDQNDVMYATEYVSYDSIDELASSATDVLRVEILGSRVELVNTMLPPFDPDEDISAGYEIHTIHEIRILEVFKGDAEVGGIMEVMQLGGTLDGTRLVNMDFIEFVYGDDLIVFLRTYDVVGLPSVLLTPDESVYRTMQLFPSPTLRADITSDDAIAAISEAGTLMLAFQENFMLGDVIIEAFSPYNHLVLTIGDLVRISRKLIS